MNLFYVYLIGTCINRQRYKLESSLNKQHISLVTSVDTPSDAATFFNMYHIKTRPLLANTLETLQCMATFMLLMD